MIRILWAAGHRVMPWKNGGGSTTEIIVEPKGAGLDAFDWRISMADVASDGAFSRFPGVDRTLAILAGAGMRLDIEGQGAEQARTLDLTRASAPAAFPADAPTLATLTAGPIRDLNVMTRRGVFAHRVTRHMGMPLDVMPGRGTLLVLSRAAGLTIACASGDKAVLNMDDAAILDRAATLTPTGQGEFFLIELWPADAKARH